MTRNQFFLLLFIVVIGPFVVCKLCWLATSKPTTGIMYYVGHDGLGSAMGISTYPVIQFKTGRDTVLFRGNINLQFHPGEPVPVRYQKNNPSDAKINRPICIWGDTLVYALGPFLVLVILFFTPDSLDPLIPRRSRVFLGRNPLIKIIHL